MWTEITTGLAFGGLVMTLFLLGHLVGVLLLRRSRQQTDLTPEQAAILSQFMDQPR